jgi:hypothetical protein
MSDLAISWAKPIRVGSVAHSEDAARRAVVAAVPRHDSGRTSTPSPVRPSRPASTPVQGRGVRPSATEGRTGPRRGRPRKKSK